ncbi:MAG: Nodulation formation efficiency D like protein [Candidatus Tokpelaia hoelldobleri]|uniref:Nodulation formation efficiency D like protein n=1 Tax=Candidatus Tokpelaia hoelldobleri TaxID=1902579 RepID=A0A1U9JTC0_9HYPH|nr:MAG: Nodulation formation efficiency D like protein [Candidatus Tokpelaia hoelldoblerii]
MELLTISGLWNWVILGFALLLLELLIPGVFLVWIGIAALITAIFSALANIIGLLAGWQSQIVVFLLLCVVLVWITQRFAAQLEHSEAPLLNRRTDEMLDMVITLSEPLHNGSGHTHIDDTIWRITGKDMPKGTRIRLVAYQNGAFQVEPDTSF